MQRSFVWLGEREGALGYASQRLSVPPADAYGVASFYALLALEERPADVTHVCTDLSCALKGARVGPGEHPSPCLGLCERAPASYRTIAGVEPRHEELQLPEAGPPLPQAGDCRSCVSCAGSAPASTRRRSTPTSQQAASSSYAGRASSAPAP